MLKHAKHSVFCVFFAFVLRLLCVLFASQAKEARKAPPQDAKQKQKNLQPETAPKSETQNRDARKHTIKCKNKSLGTPALRL